MMENRRVVFPRLNFDFHSPIHFVHKQLTTFISSSQDERCSSSDPTSSVSNFKTHPQDLSDSNDDQSLELVILTQRSHANTNINFSSSRVANDENSCEGSQAHLQHPVNVEPPNPTLCILKQYPCSSEPIFASSPGHPHSSIPKFVLKSKSAKIQGDDETKSDATNILLNKFYTTGKNSQNKPAACLSFSKVDINAMECIPTQKVKGSLVPPPAKTAAYQTIQNSTESYHPADYVPPPPSLFVRGRINSVDYDSENSVSEDYDFLSETLRRPLHRSKVDDDEDDPNCFLPPKLPSHIQTKLLETIQSMKSTGQPRREDQGEGEIGDLIYDDEDSGDSKIHHLSFHYETKDGNIDNLTATGFSVNFHYSNEIDGQTSTLAPNPVSTYFPGKPVSRSQSNTVNSLGFEMPIPSFMKQDFCTEKDDKGTSTHELPFIMENFFKKCRRSLSNLSMMPMVYSENCAAPGTQELQDSEFRSPKPGIKEPSTRLENVKRSVKGKNKRHPPKDKPKMPNATKTPGPDMNNNSKLNSQSESRFSTHHPDVSKRLKPYTESKPRKIINKENLPEMEAKKNIIPSAPKKLNIVEKSPPRPPTRRTVSNIITPSTNNLQELQLQSKIQHDNIAKATKSLHRDIIRRTSSVGSVNNLKSISSANLRSNHTLSSHNFGGFPKVRTAPDLAQPSQSDTLTKKPSQVRDISQKKNRPPMPSTMQNDVPNSTRRVAKKLNAQLEQGHHGSEATETTSSKVEKALKSSRRSLPMKKLKSRVANDPYYLNSTESEKLIIKELVRADVDAMLERDAVALLLDEDELVAAEPPAPVAVPPVQTKVAKKEPATHWSWRAKDAIKSASVPGNKLFAGAGPKAGASKNKSRTAANTTMTKGKAKSVPASLAKSKRK